MSEINFTVKTERESVETKTHLAELGEFKAAVYFDTSEEKWQGQVLPSGPLRVTDLPRVLEQEAFESKAEAMAWARTRLTTRKERVVAYK